MFVVFIAFSHLIPKVPLGYRCTPAIDSTLVGFTMYTSLLLHPRPEPSLLEPMDVQVGVNGLLALVDVSIFLSSWVSPVLTAVWRSGVRASSKKPTQSSR